MLLQLFDQDSSTFTYLLADDASRVAAIIDPVLGQLERDLGELARHRLRLQWVLDTHVHADHETGANALKAATDATTAVGAACHSTGHDRMLVDGDVIAFGTLKIDLIATPGHTPGSMTFCCGNNIFTGDALLIEGCGRTDFQDGDSDTLFDSVTRKLFSLPDETVVWPGHDYRGRASSTIGHERTLNPRFAGKDVNAFRTIMAGLNLAPPTRIAEAVPANRAGGALHAGGAPLPGIPAGELGRTFDARLDRLIDLRDPSRVDAAPLAHARWMDGSELDPIRAIAAQARTLYLVCQTGRQSLAVTEQLLLAGCDNVCNVTGGVSGMHAEHRAPTTVGVPHG